MTSAPFSYERHLVCSQGLLIPPGVAETPPVTLLVPAHNEEQFIVESVRSLLAIDYPDLEVIVINDGSVDSTLEQLKRAYRLKPAKLLYIQEVPSAKVHGIYRSELQSHLIVVDKEAGGSKADAVNAGLNAATSPYVCIVDADSILERDSLLRIRDEAHRTLSDSVHQRLNVRAQPVEFSR